MANIPKNIFAVIFLTSLLLIFTLPFREKTYTFDWDQASDYQAVATIAQGKPLLIGPRVTSDTGFFLAPWHYYFLTPFYLLTGGSLYLGFWGALLVQFLLTITAFLLAKKWFGFLPGLATGIFFATPTNLTSWGYMYIPLLSLIFFYLCLKTIDQPRLLPLLFFLLGLGTTTYAVFYALGFPFIYIVVKAIRSKQVPLPKLLLGLALFALPYLPLFLFDLRHHFLNLHNFLSFAGSQHGPGTQPGYFLTVFLRALKISWLGHPLISLIVLILGAQILFPGKRLFVWLWLFSSLIPMSVFKGNVSEYYYGPVTLLLPFFLFGLLSRLKKSGSFLTLLFLVFLFLARIKNLTTPSLNIVLADKIKAIAVLDQLGQKYSVSYAFKLGEDTGYDLVFHKLGHSFVSDGSAPLYTLTYKNGPPLSGQLIAQTDKLSIYRR